MGGYWGPYSKWNNKLGIKRQILYDATYMSYLGIKFTETGNRMVVATAGGRREWRVV